MDEDGKVLSPEEILYRVSEKIILLLQGLCKANLRSHCVSTIVMYLRSNRVNAILLDIVSPQRIGWIKS